jgi:hypothetical protein
MFVLFVLFIYFIYLFIIYLFLGSIATPLNAQSLASVSITGALIVDAVLCFVAAGLTLLLPKETASMFILSFMFVFVCLLFLFVYLFVCFIAGLTLLLPKETAIMCL